MKRFADLSREEIENKRRLLTPTTTQKATTSAAKVFRDYLAEKGKPVSFEQYEKKELDAALSSFYIEARTKTGEIYKKTSLDAVRYGINRHLKSSPQNKDFDILTDPSFASSNEMFKVAMREIKAQGKAAINHHPPMSDIDRNKLYNSIYLSQATPNGLYNKVQFDIRYYFCRRGAENMHTMTKDTFEVKLDANTGRQYLYKKDELTKNHRDDSEGYTGFMPATGTHDCPVSTFLKYIEKLHPESERLWCYPRDSFHDEDTTWYTCKPVGKHGLQQFLPKLSKQCGLSQIYTNHSIRATSATVLHRASHAPAAIQSVTGHKSLSSLAIYQHTSAQQKMDMGDTLHQHIHTGDTVTVPLRFVSGALTLCVRFPLGSHTPKFADKTSIYGSIRQCCSLRMVLLDL
ncbi:hypothetical protein V1264_007745 [Littorina saxatilis]|uniref:Tyr recombinase domain-containing protein n=1 Tax=Littorina saxatilis TaxID=31220 RepID=A0AAN9AX29_9CAEN